ncbi:MAG: mechanosensitive ion channel [Spirochaetales bacterium]|nr:mechanosensitive ion channel [Spirochaetales bacterium]
MDRRLIAFFTNLGLNELTANFTSRMTLILALLALAVLVNLIARKILSLIIPRLVKKTATKWDDILLKTGFLPKLAHIVPGLLLYLTFPLVFTESDKMEVFFQRVVLSYIILVVLTLFNTFLTAVNAIYSTYEMSKNRPIKGYLQILKVVASLMAFILVISVLMDRSALGLLSGIGALSAVLMLVFKDSILGLVAAIQLSGNDMVRIGDWISVPAHGADGDVVDIKLQTVTVQNFDKTLVNVPIYSLISSSFRNWRGMSESEGRRIKRHINIDMNSVKFCSEEMLKDLRKIDLIREFIPLKKEEIDRDNKEKSINTGHMINGRRMTNLGIFRAYLGAYLKANPQISDSMTFLVRQLQPTDKGIPLEIYVFSKDKVWANYEGIQADIFDHLLAAIPFFDLAVYQSPSSLDLKQRLKEPAETWL